MKLNKNGWGFREMLFLMTFLIVCLILVIYLIYRLYDNLEKKGVTNSEQQEIKTNDKIKINEYENLEIELKNGAVIYLKNYYQEEIKGKITITLSDIKSVGIMSNVIDPKDNSLCDGYVIVEIAETISYYPYIKCANYQTEGY